MFYVKADQMLTTAMNYVKYIIFEVGYVSIIIGKIARTKPIEA